MNVPIDDIQKVLPAAVVFAADNAAAGLLPEGGGSDIGIESIPDILRTAMFALEAGAVDGYPTHLALGKDMSKVRAATRRLVDDWMKHCRFMHDDTLDDVWRDHAEAAERVLAWLDSLDREGVTS